MIQLLRAATNKHHSDQIKTKSNICQYTCKMLNFGDLGHNRGYSKEHSDSGDDQYNGPSQLQI